jgi:hypothetical protein
METIMTDNKQLVLQVPAEISRVQTMNDGGLRLSVDTQELNSADKGTVMEMHKKIGWFLFAEQPIDVLEATDLPKIVKNDEPRTPSEALRARMYVYFVDKTKGLGRDKKEFNEWYRQSLDKIGLNYLEKLK